MKDFIEYVARALVDYPDDVVINEVAGERTVVYELRCNPDDVGKVIGKNGKTISALRVLLTSAAAKGNRRAMLEIVE